jgi:hypothetical protein
MVGSFILASDPETTGDLACKSQETRHNANQSRYHGILQETMQSLMETKMGDFVIYTVNCTLAIV